MIDPGTPIQSQSEGSNRSRLSQVTSKISRFVSESSPGSPNVSLSDRQLRWVTFSVISLLIAWILQITIICLDELKIIPSYWREIADMFAVVLTVTPFIIAFNMILSHSRLRALPLTAVCLLILAELFDYLAEFETLSSIEHPIDVHLWLRLCQHIASRTGFVAFAVAFVYGICVLTKTFTALEAGLERSRREVALREEAQKTLSTLEETTSVGLLIIQNGEIVHSNNAANRMFGAISDLGRSALGDFIPTISNQSCEEEIGSSTKEWTHAEVAHDIVIQDLDGDTRTISVQSTKIEYKGKPAIVLTCSDMTDRIRAEQEAILTHERYRALISESVNGILILQPPTNIVYASPGMLKILGYVSTDNLRNCSLLEFLPPEEKTHVAQWISNLWNLPSHSSLLDTQVIQGDGKTRSIEIKGTDHSHNPAIEGLVLNVRDITDRNRLQDELHQSRKMEALGQLAGGVAHDFNNIIAVVLMRSEILEDAANGDSQLRDGLKEIRETIARASALTRQLLLFSRKEKAALQVLDVNEIVEGLTKMLGRVLPANIDLHTELAPGGASIQADTSQIEQMILNLAINARDAMQEGGVLSIRTRMESEDEIRAGRLSDEEVEPAVILEVSDTGCGMDEETQSHAFEPFFTTKSRGMGTGLGLATVYAIVKQSSGDVTIQSVVGEGTTFRVRFPFHRPEEPSTYSVRDVDASVVKGETVLILEDDQDIRIAIRAILEKRGYEVCEAGSGEEALSLLEEKGYAVDLFLSDVVLPGMSGPSAAEAVLEVCGEMKFLFMSGYTEGLATYRDGPLAEVPLIQKPFDSATIARAVRDALDTPASSTPNATDSVGPARDPWGKG